jgi:hypothetical protein
MPPVFDPMPQGKESIMRMLFAITLFVVLAACQASAAPPSEDDPNSWPIPTVEGPVLAIRPSIPLVRVASYEESLFEAVDENALTEEEQKDLLVDLQATMAVKHARVELLRTIHQLEAVENKCKGTPVAEEAAQLLKLLPKAKDLQPSQSAAATAIRKKANVARHSRVTPAEATMVR